MIRLLDKLERDRRLTKEEWVRLLAALEAEASGESEGPGVREKSDSYQTQRAQEAPGEDTPARPLSKELTARARETARKTFGNRVYTRGLVEFTNYCRNNCYYCGIRAGNQNVDRYRLTADEIMECCREGYKLGFRTFVLQGGEDPGFPDRTLAHLVTAIKSEYPDCAVTLSVGERDRATYQMWYDAGADRYLLRHETADPDHYRMLHPSAGRPLSLANRIRCLRDLKEIGYQVGTGFMVGSPGQSVETMAEDFVLIQELQPHMVGIGPFVPHHDTPFAKEKGGTAEQTLRCISLLRLLLPQALIPATTALGTIDPAGREKGILAGANVVMPNLSPTAVREKYELYDNKICTGEEAAECRGCLSGRMELIGYELAVDRGDHPSREDAQSRGDHSSHEIQQDRGDHPSRGGGKL